MWLILLKVFSLPQFRFMSEKEAQEQGNEKERKQCEGCMY